MRVGSVGGPHLRKAPSRPRFDPMGSGDGQRSCPFALLFRRLNLQPSALVRFYRFGRSLRQLDGWAEGGCENQWEVRTILPCLLDDIQSCATSISFSFSFNVLSSSTGMNFSAALSHRCGRGHKFIVLFVFFYSENHRTHSPRPDAKHVHAVFDAFLRGSIVNALSTRRGWRIYLLLSPLQKEVSTLCHYVYKILSIFSAI